MDLILWRHAEAEKATADLPDYKRRLTPGGEKQAVRMADWLKPRLPRKVRILVAPSRRAVQTADFLGLPYTVERLLGVGATTADLLAAAGWPDAAGPALLVCHQPSIGRVVSLFLTGAEIDLAIRKAGLIWLSSREREHRASVILRAAMHPEFV